LRQASVDSKGRLKLPVAIKEYLSEFGDTKVFITSLDGRIARIYPISTWRAMRPSRLVMGADCEMDAEGRLLVPQELRKRLNLENQPVWLHCHKSRINVYNTQVYQEMQARAAIQRQDKLQLLEKNGLK